MQSNFNLYGKEFYKYFVAGNLLIFIKKKNEKRRTFAFSVNLVFVNFNEF